MGAETTTGTTTDTTHATKIEISKDYLHFSSAHFTMFSASERENLHGHTFYVKAFVDCNVGEDGLAFDYNILKKKLKALCDGIDEKVLLPAQSPYLSIEQDDQYVVAEFAGERLPFLPRDVLVLELRNITVEELAVWFLQRLVDDGTTAQLELLRLEIQVSSGPGQWASSSWAAA